MALNPFQVGQQFQLSQEASQLDLEAGRRRERGIEALAAEFGQTALAPQERAAVAGSERAERRFVSDQEQRALTNQRRSVDDAVAVGERKRAATLRFVNMVDAVVQKNGDVGQLLADFPGGAELLGLQDADASEITSFVQENPEQVQAIKAGLTETQRETARRVVRTVEGTANGETRFFNVFSDGTTEEVSDVTPLRERQLDIRERGVELRGPESQEAIAEAKAVGKATGEVIAEDLPTSKTAIAKQQATFRTQKTGTDRTLTALRKAKGEVSGLSSGLFGGLTKAIPGSPAFNLETRLLPAVSRAFVENLQNMRDMSKTGGAVGNVSDAEGSRLAGLDVSLETGQSKDQLTEAIDIMIEAIETSQANIRSAFAEDQAARDTLDEGEDIEDIINRNLQ